MGVVITRDDIIAYAEVDYIIHHMNERYISKVPEKILNFFSTIKDPNYVVYVNPRVPLENQNLKHYTLELVALLHLKYWCEDEQRRNMLYEKMKENQRKLDKQMQEKYSIDNMFDLNSAKVVTSETDLNHQEDNSLSNYDNNTDFSTPKQIIKYDVGTQNNADISSNENNAENFNYDNNTTNMVDKGKVIAKKVGFLEKIINRIKSIFIK